MSPWAELIERLGSQAEAAEAVGIDESRYCRYRQGTRTPRPKSAVVLATRLTELLDRQVSPVELLVPTTAEDVAPKKCACGR
jgi:hypothetical protein